MPTIHELLDDTQKQCQTLVEEIESFKKAKSLNQKAADGLNSVCEALKATAKAIEPFTELRIRKIMFILIAATGLNFVMFLTILLIFFLEK